jgi:hypothetical protein
MKNTGKFFIAFNIMSLSINYVIGQETNFTSNIRRYLSPVVENQLVIKYDLVFKDTAQLFDIILKIHYNDKEIQPQENTLTGSWGSKVKPGPDKVILWDFPSDLKNDINKVKTEVIASKTSEPLVDFDYEILVKKPPYVVKFYNKSKNTDYSYWKFGDLKSGMKNLSELQNPVHNYKKGGNYNVELKAGSSKTKTDNTIIKAISIGKGNIEELQKHKKLRTIWSGSAIATAGIGGFSILQYYKLEDKYRTTGDEAFHNKSVTYRSIGIASIVVSGACISQVIIQSIKIRALDKALSVNLIPLENGCLLGLAVNF